MGQAEGGARAGAVDQDRPNVPAEVRMLKRRKSRYERKGDLKDQRGGMGAWCANILD